MCLMRARGRTAGVLASAGLFIVVALGSRTVSDHAWAPPMHQGLPPVQRDKNIVYGVPATASHPSKWNPQIVGQRVKLVYERVPGYTGTLYLFRPAHSHAGAALLPVVVYFHGGALERGSAVIGHNPRALHDWLMAHIEAAVIRSDCAFVSVNYRLAPKYKWPNQIVDAKTAIRFLRAHAVQYHLSPNQVAVMGDSAGGSLASLVGLSSATSKFDGGPWAHESSSVSAVVDMFGPVDRRFTQHTWMERHGARPNPVFGLLSASVVYRASAVSYVHRDAPPFLIVQGTRDTVVPPWLSIELYHRLRHQHDAAELLLVRHSEHEFIPSGGPIQPNMATLSKDITRFLVDKLRANPAYQVSRRQWKV